MGGESILKRAHVTILAALAFTVPCLRAQQIEVKNSLDFDRPEEVVEIPLAQVLAHLHASPDQASAIAARDSQSGKPVPVQVYGDNPDAKPTTLLVLAHVPAHGVEQISFRLDPKAPKLDPLVFGREAPERKDDFAWENEWVTYRVYGPALQATGEIASGIDVWSKRVPNFVIDSFYKRDLEGQRTNNPSLSYHKDNGVGLDSYYVGPTRGCGGTAVFKNGKLFVSKNYTKLRMLGDGPIRFAFEVSYAPWDADGTTVSETKRIVLDAGTRLNNIESTYTFDGSGELSLAAGIAVHQGASADFPVANEVASVWDTPQTASAGRIATGLVVLPDQHATSVSAADHALMLFKRHSGEPFHYFAGAGWSKADMPNPQAWNTYLKQELQTREHPLEVGWMKR